MTGKTAPPTTPETKDPRTRCAHDADALVGGLERLREGLTRRLDQIEALAAEQARLLDQDVSEREYLLQGKLSVLEATLARLQAEAKRREQESQAALQQLEGDRRLLADAWERLEQEQIEATAAAAAAAAAPGPDLTAADRTSSHRPAADDPADGAVTRAILREFQALKSDVRRNAQGRTGH